MAARLKSEVVSTLLPAKNVQTLRRNRQCISYAECDNRTAVSLQTSSREDMDLVPLGNGTTFLEDWTEIGPTHLEHIPGKREQLPELQLLPKISLQAIQLKSPTSFADEIVQSQSVQRRSK